MSEFEGKIVLVTGYARARGMGRAISVAIAPAGATDVAPPADEEQERGGLAKAYLESGRASRA